MATGLKSRETQIQIGKDFLIQQLRPQHLKNNESLQVVTTAKILETENL